MTHLFWIWFTLARKLWEDRFYRTDRHRAPDDITFKRAEKITKDKDRQGKLEV